MINAVMLAVKINRFSAEANGCKVNAQWSVAHDAVHISHLAVPRSENAIDEIVGHVKVG